MKVESGQHDVDFRETRESQRPGTFRWVCGVCNQPLTRLGPTDNFICPRGHQTTAKRLFGEGRL